jgi:putative transposase
MRTFVYRLYPTKEQQKKLWLHANKLNFLYNYFLNQRIENYKNGKKISRIDQQAELVPLKQADISLKEIHSNVLQQVTWRLERAYQNFFRRVKRKETPGFPKFRNCKNFFGICYPTNGFWIENNVLRTKAYGKIPLIKHQEIIGKVKQIQITNKNNQWFVNIVTEHVNIKENVKTKIGIDLGITNLVVASNGLKVKNCSHDKYFDQQISKIQSRVDKLKKGSRKNKFLNNVKRKLYALKTRKIRDFQHKVSRDLSRKYDTIYMENLSVKKMTESKITGLNRSIRNACLSQLITYLQYKVNNTILVNPKWTSKICNSCGFLHENLKLQERTIHCSCGAIYDRDENASKNIYCLGQAIEQKLCAESATIREVFAKKLKQSTAILRSITFKY